MLLPDKLVGPNRPFMLSPSLLAQNSGCYGGVHAVQSSNDMHKLGTARLADAPGAASRRKAAFLQLGQITLTPPEAFFIDPYSPRLGELGELAEFVPGVSHVVRMPPTPLPSPPPPSAMLLQGFGRLATGANGALGSSSQTGRRWDELAAGAHLGMEIGLDLEPQAHRASAWAGHGQPKTEVEVWGGGLSASEAERHRLQSEGELSLATEVKRAAISRGLPASALNGQRSERSELSPPKPKSMRSPPIKPPRQAMSGGRGRGEDRTNEAAVPKGDPLLADGAHPLRLKKATAPLLPIAHSQAALLHSMSLFMLGALALLTILSMFSAHCAGGETEAV